MRRLVRGLGLVLLTFELSSRAAAQSAAPTGDVSVGSLTTIGSDAEDRSRIDQLLGRAPTAGFLLRSAATLTPPAARDSAVWMRVELLPPDVRATWNSTIPFSGNDGALWAGKGASVATTLGLRVSAGPVTATLAPEIDYQQNLPFDVIPYSFGDRSQYASPWHNFPESMDLPLRFGNRAFSGFGWGQSELAVRAGPATMGFSAQSQWWGPGIRNAILMSSNAAGIPRLFLRTSAPLRTPLGEVNARWMIGTLNESRYFDFDSTNDRRSISALALTLAPAVAPDLTIGVARAVYAPLERDESAAQDALNVFTNVGRPDARPKSDLERTPGPDQLLSLFARWVFPENGFEAYAEWARIEFPASFRDFITAPQHTQGYTVGLQWARPVHDNGTIRLQTELTDLEQSSTFRQRRVITYYTSRPVLQGYTQRGQTIGASIGPAASSQWIAGDYLTSHWRVGLFAGRIRWENDEYYYARYIQYELGHDVSVFAGVRGGVSLPFADVQLEYTGATRFNYLFQYLSTGLADHHGMDLRNHTLQLNITPHVY